MIRSILKQEIPKDSIVIWMDSLIGSDMLRHIRENEAGRLKVFVFEELVAVVENMKMEKLLDFLDGEKSVDKSLVIGTTNYPERLPSNIVDRPSRFDKLYKIDSPSAKVRKQLLDHYLGREATQQDVDATKGFSVAAIKEVCLFSRLKSISLVEAIKAIRQHKELVANDFAQAKKISLSRSDDDDE